MLLRSVLLSLAITVFLSGTVKADPCQEYYGKGYCTDYVEQRIKNRQRGDAKNWEANILLDEVRRDDVVIFDNGKWGHVAVVDKVHKNASGHIYSIDISEMNWGRFKPGNCAVSDKFGIVTNRTIDPKIAKGFWRP